MRAFLLGVLLGLAGCSTPGPQAGDEAEYRASLAREVNDELALGRQMAAKLCGHFGVSPDARAHKYVSLVGHTLARRVGRPELTFYFGVLKGREVNAFATPGGYIFVTEGLLRAVTSESELAGVLAHEIAHVNDRHMVEELFVKKSMTAGDMMMSLMSRGRSTLGVSLGSYVNKGMELLLQKGYSEAKELDADGAGILYATEVGYDPGGLSRFLGRAKGKLGISNRPSEARLESLRRQEIRSAALGDEKEMARRFASFTARLRK